jgi:transposase-like protein
MAATATLTWPLDSADWFRDLEAVEQHCRAYLEHLRWPDGVVCARCGGGDVGEIRSRNRYYCRGCKYQFGVTAGTIFHNSHLPLWKWFLAVAVMLDATGGLPANQLRTLLGGSYKTAWFTEHRIRVALGGRPADVPACNRLYGAPAGCHPPIGVRYLSAYWAESRWREETRALSDPCGETMAKLLEADPVEWAELVGRTRVAT